MRRVNIHLDEQMDAEAERVAARLGIPKAELVRRGLARELAAAYDVDRAWLDFVGGDAGQDVEDLDAEVYG